MLEHFTPTDNVHDDNDYHKQVRAQAQQPATTADDREFTIEETRKAVDSTDNKKAPGENGITGDIYKQTFETFPKYIIAMYNGCLRQGVFPKRWKREKLIPIIKPGKENSDEALKYRPISLLNVVGKVLEIAMINRINHRVYTNGYTNNNQYGFTPQVSTTDAAMAVKELVEEMFRAGEFTVIISLYIKGAFNSAWWPSILKSLKECGCPQNLYKLTKGYFSQRTATLLTNNIRLPTRLLLRPGPLEHAL